MLWKKSRITSAPPTSVPIVLPTFANMTTSKTFVTLFFQNPLKLNTSSASVSKSLTLGFLIKASTNPANQPAASNGFKEEMGATTKAVKMDNG